MRRHINTIKAYLIAHKAISIVILIVLLGLGYWGYKKFTSTANDVRYITTKIKRGEIISSISGSGQISSLNQVDIKAKVSGDVVYIAAQDGQKIGNGGLIARLDAKDAEKSVRDAEINLESSKIVLAKLKIEKSQENMEADLAKSYDDGFNTVSNVFLDLPEIMTGLDDIFFESNPATGQWNIDWYEGQVNNEDRDKTIIFKQDLVDSYHAAKKAYDTSFDNYKTTSRSSSSAVIEALILQIYETTKIISDSIKNANNYVDFVNDSIQKNNFDEPTIIATHKATLNTYTSDTNAHLLSLLSIKTSIKEYKDAFLNADLDIQSAELSLRQKENALQDAKDKLADYFIHAPFEGTIAKINVKKSDSISAGATAATLITKKQLAEISLNEVDVAKIKIGQTTMLTFDAIPDLTIAGIVSDIDTIGAVEQGVVTYIIKVSFDVQDERIKTGMSVSGAIITDKKQNVLVLPNSAIKSLSAQTGQVDQSYVENFDTSLVFPPVGKSIGAVSKMIPNKIPVEVGLVGDSYSEIISGIKEEDEIIIRTILPTTTSPSAPSIFGSPATGNRGTSGGNVRIQTR